jgi:type I restriction enzyme R subunit
MRVRVMRQVHFSTADQRSIDLVFFVNGLPVATAELKTDFTQSLDEAISQYRKDRHPVTNGRPEPLLSFGHRALVHFAVSNDLAAMTTRLEGEKTHFLPFNIGHDHGAGNPPGKDGRSATAYLWERVWEKDAWLNIIGRLMIVETKEEWDVATGTSVRRTSMLFPRFHQWEAVTNIVAAVAEEGVGQRYLIEHSAGSGKTNTIAWTAHRLARLHVNDEKVFDSVIVVVDRTVLDGQLQEAIRQIDGSGKIVATISPEDVRKAGAKSKSGLLATALKNGELIIAVTVQTFPFALDEIRADSSLKGRKFAVIADEAHSSQSGQISSKLKAVLTAEEVKEIEDGGTVDVEAVLAAEMTERAESQNISYLAFTATPKNKTLELFGRKGPDGKPAEFHLYSMRQAIEEGYILDVLKGYQSYDTALKIAGKIDESDEVEEGAARKGLMRWVKLHPTNISQKVQIIVEHFHANVAYLLEGKAKAMVVTDSRKAAVKYKKAIDAYIAKRAAEDASYNYRTLVAFSSSVSMAENEEWATDWGPRPGTDDELTEANLNPGAGSDLAAAFKGETYKIMLVANKSRPASTSPCSRRCTSTRSSPASPPSRPCPGSTGPTAPRAGSRSARRSSSTSPTSPRTSGLRSSRTSPTPPWRPRPTPMWSSTSPPSSPRPGSTPRTKCARLPGCGSSARATTRSRPRSARPSTTSPAATPPRLRPTTRSPSAPSTCSARTSPPTSGSTTSCPRSSTTATRTWRCCRSSCASWRRSSPTPPGPPRSTSPTSSWSGSSTAKPSRSTSP